MFFANDQREKVREENPGIKFGKSALLSPKLDHVLIQPRRGRQGSR